MGQQEADQRAPDADAHHRQADYLRQHEEICRRPVAGIAVADPHVTCTRSHEYACSVTFPFLKVRMLEKVSQSTT